MIKLPALKKRLMRDPEFREEYRKTAKEFASMVRGLKPMHPGELLREEVLPALGRPKTEIARLLGVSRQTLYAILKENQPVTAEMAVRIGKLCGNGPDLWLNLQMSFDLKKAAREIDTSKIPTLTAA